MKARSAPNAGSADICTWTAEPLLSPWKSNTNGTGPSAAGTSRM